MCESKTSCVGFSLGFCCCFVLFGFYYDALALALFLSLSVSFFLANCQTFHVQSLCLPFACVSPIVCPSCGWFVRVVTGPTFLTSKNNPSTRPVVGYLPALINRSISALIFFLEGCSTDVLAVFPYPLFFISLTTIRLIFSPVSSISAPRHVIWCSCLGFLARYLT